MTDQNQRPTAVFNRDEAQWPMEYALRPPQENAPPRRWWQHQYYRGPQDEPVEVLYSKTKSQSETIAQQFANEPVLGFDMEWPWDSNRRPKLQDKVALIQLATERKVALFHIALHEGQTTDDLIAPTLKAIIESSSIMKTGVAIISADFSRLRKHFRLQPKGAFELSHLHNLVTHGATTPRLVTTRLCSLSSQVEQHLGLPLWKGDVRTSDWSQSLNPNQTQYAATDAYACFMLFYCMNAKRLAMDPAPPFPRLAETYRASTTSRSLQLESVTEGGEIRVVTMEEFVYARNRRKQDEEATEVTGVTEVTVSIEETNNDVHPRITVNIPDENDDEVKGVRTVSREDDRQPDSNPLGSESNQTQTHVGARKAQNDAKREGNNNTRTSMDSSCRSLYDRLRAHRLDLARSEGTATFIIAHNTLLETLARHRPSNEQELLLLRGVGKQKAAKYGPAWLEIIANFEREQSQVEGHDIEQEAGSLEEHEDPGPIFRDRNQRRRRIVRIGRSKEILFPPDDPSAVPSTGLSLEFGETSLAGASSAPPRPETQDYSDNDSLFGSLVELPLESDLKRKREFFEPTGPEEEQTPPPGKRRVISLEPETQTIVRMGPAVEPTPTTGFRLRQPASLESISAPTPIATPASTSTTSEAHVQMPLASLNWERTILRKKLEAYVKNVIWAMHLKPTEPLVSESTLQHLITTVPRTAEEFHRIPGIQQLAKACEAVKMDVWRAFEKWTRSPGLAPSAGSSQV
ncbi:hypothetical protein NUW58_g2728 [Xylaria curta]|uniref:Uncharacterized protein n=1 Tax=Xylaria curta TaxID=42375 RepID=A0ACC1PFX7_9PEZI|nr:hypothetical protein NUW58_g2728 [Xylaria curta]